MRKLEISNSRVCDFYEAHPGIDIETTNLWLVDLLEKAIPILLHPELSASIQTKMLSSLNENSKQMGELKDCISSLSGRLTDMNSNLTAKFAAIKEEYIEDVKSIFHTHTEEDLGPFLEKNNNVLLDKTSGVLSELLPKNQTQLIAKITEDLQTFHKAITEDTQTMLKSADSHSIKEFLSNFEVKSTMMLQNVQQPMYSFISASEDRINTSINALKEGSHTSLAVQTKIADELGALLHRFQDQTVSQQFSNKQLSSMLTKMYTTAEFKTIHGSTYCGNGPIFMKRYRKNNILIENKDVETNIDAEDIHQFMTLMDEHNTNGIFVSQKSGFSAKKNYQIEIHNNNVIVFVHTMEYNPQKIEIAIDIVDCLSNKLRQFKSTGSNENECAIPKDVLDSINNEYQLFMTQKNAVVEVFKESQKKVLSQIDELRFPMLDKFLSTKYSAPIQKPGLKCDLCKSFSGNNLKALAAHKRGCIRKNNLSQNKPTAVVPMIGTNASV
jgi:hypothetical protein